MTGYSLKNAFLTLSCIVFSGLSSAATEYPKNTILERFENARDTVDVKLLHEKLNEILGADPVLAGRIAQRIISLSATISYPYGEGLGFLDMGKVHWVLSDYTKSLEYFYKSLEIFESLGKKNGIGSVYNDISLIYIDQKNYKKALENLFRAKRMNEELQHSRLETILLLNIGECYLHLNKTDSAGYYTQAAHSLAISNKDTTSIYGILNNLGKIYHLEKKYSLSLEHYKTALEYARLKNDKRYIIEILLNIGEHFRQDEPSSGINYIREAYQISLHINSGKRIYDAVSMLAEAYERKGMTDSAYYYSKFLIPLKDSLAGADKIRLMTRLEFEEALRQEKIQEREKKDRKFRTDLIQYMLIALMLIAVLSVILFLRKKRARYRFLFTLATMGLLFLFELISYILHPLVGSISDYSPLLMVAILTLVASGLVPLHHRLEQLAKKHLFIKRRKIK